jgi:hypothetical protein
VDCLLDCWVSLRPVCESCAAKEVKRALPALDWLISDPLRVSMILLALN